MPHFPEDPVRLAVYVHLFAHGFVVIEKTDNVIAQMNIRAYAFCGAEAGRAGPNDDDFVLPEPYMIKDPFAAEAKKRKEKKAEQPEKNDS
jgi:hypothetical protein